MPDKSDARVPAKMRRKDYEPALRAVQIELSKLQRWIEAEGKRVCVVIEGRDAAGKDGVIKRILEYLPPRRARAVALPKPSDRDRTSWYFQRYVPHLPANGELVLFNRSWYNRAGVEPVMGFCTSIEYEQFMRETLRFEEMLADAGMPVIKYYLDIAKETQAKRLKKRKTDPLKWWKSSPLDEAAQKRWDDYSTRRDEMFRRTHHRDGEWTVVDANVKRRARLALIADLLSRFEYSGRDAKAARAPDPGLAATFDEELIKTGWLAT